MIKQLELQLNKRLFIWEIDSLSQFQAIIYFQCRGLKQKYSESELLKLICKGSELTEEIAKGLVEKKQVFDTPAVFFFKNYKNKFSDCMTALEAFISAIESKNMFWGDNPFRNRTVFGNKEFNKKEFEKWQEAQSRTFDLDKTLIFEII